MESWFKEIERARTEAEVVASARDFCSLLHPRELDGLPEECRCLRIEAGTDIPRLRERVTQGVAHARPDIGSDRLRDLLDYLARASERLGELGQKH